MFRNKMDLVERWMAGLGLTAKLRRKIKTFYAEVGRRAGVRAGGQARAEWGRQLREMGACS